MLKKFEELPQSLMSYVDRNKGTLWQVIKAYRANLRQGTVGVKTRAMVQSTGKKPYKQKKTGSARRGSFVSPLNVGGGVAHGPKARSYYQSIPPKMAKVALGIAVAARAQAGKVFLAEEAELLNIQSGKTKDAYAVIKETMTSHKSRTALVCLDSPNAETIRAFRNIRGVTLVSPEQVNALSILETRNLIMSSGAFKILESRLVD